MLLAENALEGIRVIDLSRIMAGPYCTMLLADYGADVIKIEQPGSGDGTRQWGPPWIGGESAYFLSVNRNKQSVTVNLKTPEGQAIVRRLAAGADVLIENFKPGTVETFGLQYEKLSLENPALIYCSITGYGQTGPYRHRPGYDFMIQAQGGVMSVTGPADGEPHKVGVAIVDITAGLFAGNAILAALYERERSGRGQYIDVALLDAQLGWLANVAHNYFADGQKPLRFGNAHPNIVPYESFATADGHIAVAIGSDDQYQRFCRVAGCPDLCQEERFLSNAGRVQHRQELIPLLQDLFRSRPTDEWLDLLLQTGIPAGPINDIPTILDDPQVQARDMVQQLEHPTAGPIKLLGPVAKLSRTPAKLHSAPPTLGADTGRILSEQLGYSAAEIATLQRRGII
jgi:crotonobetainyl-CoA:carnitine CoA-transferase CaiB-like acyl-CoA transferase